MARRRTTTTKKRKTPAPAPRQASLRLRRPAAASAAAPKPLPPPTSTLEEELMAMARGGVRTLRSVLVTLFVVAGLTGIGYIVWTLRPTPTFASEAAEEGSPFDTIFRVENGSASMALANLKVSCVLAQVRASGIEPTLVEARDVRLPANDVAGLMPGQTATFTCPFRALIGHPIAQDAEKAKRAEIYFRAQYDVPWLAQYFRFLRITDDSGHFFLNTRLLPPRWTPVPFTPR
ncbi:MAG: hypothetical protein IBJ17_06935 [Reyranella sp.]|nr:hypothetical protein [Reyranella sp.]